MWTDYWMDFEYDGFIYEQKLSDGSFKLSVTLEVFDMYVDVVEDTPGIWRFWWYVDFVFEITFILDYEIPGGYVPWGGRI